MTNMSGKVALVVGGATGIGFAIAERLAAEGATVFLTGRGAEVVQAAAAKIGRGTRGLVADAGAARDLVDAVATVRETHGRIDGLVLNAGISEPATIEDSTDDHVDRHFALNVRGAVTGLQAALPAMQTGSAVVLIGSVASTLGVAGRGAYSATKAALRSYARSWTAELAPRGIRVNVVSPGPTDTAMMAAAPADLRDRFIAEIPLGRMARPEEVASAACFLLGPDASYIAGVELFVDGGLGQV